MKNLFAVLLLAIVFGCAKKEDLEKNFKSTLIAYQMKFPIPTDSKSKGKRIYVYSAYFWKNKKDTLLVLSRSAAGITKEVKGYGIYQDNGLKPTFIIDENNLGSNFILKKVSNIDDKFYWKEKSFPEGTPPIYTYLVKEKDLKLIKVDTVWSHWD